MEVNNIKIELEQTFYSFFNFSMDLVEKLDNKNDNLKFAVVNMQITLELFLKLYYFKKGEEEKVINIKNQKTTYKDFSTVLNKFYSDNRWTYGNKKEFVKINEIRNSIVHRGLKSGWDDDLAVFLINCILFMHGTMQVEFQEDIIVSNHDMPKIAKNQYWIKGVKRFIRNHLNFKNYQSLTLICPYCNNRTLVEKELFNFDSVGDIDGLQCLCCFNELQLFEHVTMIDCFKCNEKKTYVVETLNPQKKCLHMAKCLNCETKKDVRKCSSCERYYHHHLNNEECNIGDLFFCSESCKLAYEEEKGQITVANKRS